MHLWIRGRILHLVILLLALGLSGLAQAVPTRRPAALRHSRSVRNEIQTNGLRATAINQDFLKRHRTNYSVEVPRSPIRDQVRSGRCWAFAWVKTVESMARKQGVAVESLSPTFINYHALRTLAHGAIDYARRGGDHPEYHLNYLSGDMVAEGGYAHQAQAIVKQHGIVPESKMHSTAYDSRESGILQNQLHRLVAAATEKLTAAVDKTPKQRRAMASSYKKKVDSLLKTLIGAPPKRFTIDGKTYTPRSYRKEFLKIKDGDLSFVNLSHDPQRAWNRRYREVYGDTGIPENHTYNVSMKTIQQAVRKTLKNGVAVNVAVNVDWDNPHRVAPREDSSSSGSSTENRSSDSNGILSLKAFRYDKLIDPVKLTKRERLNGQLSLANHMMAITGHEPAKGSQQARWQIDNSHGDKSFRGGRFDMYNDFFKQYVEEVTVPKSALPAKLLNKIERTPAVDAVYAMPPVRKGSKEWTPSRRRALVKAVMREDFGIAEAAKRYNLKPQTLKKWCDQAEKALLRSQY